MLQIISEEDGSRHWPTGFNYNVVGSSPSEQVSMHKRLNWDPEVPRHRSYASNQETGETGQCAFDYPLNAN